MISNILDHPVPKIDAPVLTPTRYVSLRGLAEGFPVRSQVEVNEKEQEKSEKSKRCLD